MASLRLDDRWLWLGFGVVSVLAVHGIRLAMRDLVTMTKLDPYSFEPKNVKNNSVRPEDAISVKTLETLAASTDPNIANSAISLLVSRIRRSKTEMLSIRKDLRSEDQDTRHTATIAFDFLRQWPDIDDDVERSPSPIRRSGRRSHRSDSDAEQSTGDALAILLERERLQSMEASQTNELGFNPWAIAEEEDAVVPSIENPVAGWTDVPRERTSSIPHSDIDEVERRRRRREAIVLHDGVGRLEERDIIRPVSGSRGAGR